MSKPPASSSAEWKNSALINLQIYAVGVDSVVPIFSPDMSWLPTNFTTYQIALLFSDTTPFANNVQSNTTIGGQGNVAPGYFNTWGDFLTNQSISTAGLTSAELTEPITRIVRDPTSGTMDCFNTYFASPNGFTFVHKTSGTADGSENMATYTYEQTNYQEWQAVDTTSGSVGFLSLGYLQTYGQVIPANIAFNTQQPTGSGSDGSSGSTMIHYYGPSGTVGQWTVAPVWSPYTVCSQANVIWAYSGIKGYAATDPYFAWRWLWEDLPNVPVTSNPQSLVTGVWIAYMMADNTTTGGANPTATAVGSGASNFVADQGYIPLDRCDMAGQLPIDSNLNTYGPSQGLLSTQTQAIPDGKVNFADLQYFVANYIAYYTKGAYNPYCDFNADGKVNFADLQGFVKTYVNYYIVYNPLYVNPLVVGQ